MNILISLLIVAFIFIEIPLFIMGGYLFRHRAINFEVSKMREILLVFIIAKIVFMISQIILLLVSLFNIRELEPLVIWSYSLATIVLTYTNWWALFELRKLT